MKKYEEMKQSLVQQIEAGVYKENQVIPSENTLCEMFQVSRTTVRKAIDEMVYEGLLYRIKGKGCFVREREENKLSHIYSFTEAMLHEGKTPSKRLISLQKEPAGGEIAQKLHIAPEDSVFRVQSLYLADGEPYCLSTSILPEKIFPKLDCFNLGEHSLYEILTNFYEISIARVQQQLEAVLGTPEIYECMGLKEEKPLLKIQATSYALFHNNEVAFEVYESYLLTDVLCYSVEKYK